MLGNRTMDFIPRRRYLSEEAAELIKERIFRRRYAPGSRLIVENLAQDIQVSMTPVREGLKELVSQGLVVYDGKSYSVFNPSEKDILDLFLIRRYLEQLCAHEAAQHMDKTVIDEMIEYYRSFQGSSLKDSLDLVRIDMEFHQKLLEGADNQRLMNMLQVVQEQCWLIRLWGFSNVYSEEFAMSTVKEHLEVLESLKAGDPDHAEKVMRDHVIHGEQRTIETLKQNNKLPFAFGEIGQL